LYVWGPAAVQTLCVLLFVLASLLALTLRFRQPIAPRETVSLATLLAGIRFIGSRRALLGAISLDLFAVLLGGATALLPMFARDILHVGPQGLGVLRAAPAIGALAMSVLLSRWPIERRVGIKLFVAIGVYGLATVLFGLSTNFLLSVFALAMCGAADMVNVVIRQSLVLLETPDSMRGRVSAVTSIFIGASNQLGEFESGLTAHWWGPVASVLVGGLGTLAVAISWSRLFPELTRRDRLGTG